MYPQKRKRGAAAKPEVDDDIGASVVGLQSSMADLKSMVELVTGTVDQLNSALSALTVRGEQVDERLRASDARIAKVQETCTRELQEQDGALTEMHETLARFTDRADKSAEAQQSDHENMFQTVVAKLEGFESEMARFRAEQQQMLRRIGDGIDANDNLTSSLDAMQQDLMRKVETEQEVLKERFVQDLQATSGQIQNNLMKQLDQAGNDAKTLFTTQLLEMSQTIRTELDSAMTNNREMLSEIQRAMGPLRNEMEKFKAFRRVAFGHKT